SKDADRNDAPEIVISAANVPVDGLLIRAIPEPGQPAREQDEFVGDAAAAAPETGSIQHLLRSLGIQGVVDAEARIGGLGSEDGWCDVDVAFDGLAMDPAGAVSSHQRLRVRDASG